MPNMKYFNKSFSISPEHLDMSISITVMHIKLVLFAIFESKFEDYYSTNLTNHLSYIHICSLNGRSSFHLHCSMFYFKTLKSWSISCRISKQDVYINLTPKECQVTLY